MRLNVLWGPEHGSAHMRAKIAVRSSSPQAMLLFLFAISFYMLYFTLIARANSLHGTLQNRAVSALIAICLNGPDEDRHWRQTSD